MTTVLLVLTVLLVWLGAGALIGPRVGRMLKASRERQERR